MLLLSLKCSFCVQHWIDIFVRADLRGWARGLSLWGRDATHYHFNHLLLLTEKVNNSSWAFAILPSRERFHTRRFQSTAARSDRLNIWRVSACKRVESLGCDQLGPCHVLGWAEGRFAYLCCSPGWDDRENRTKWHSNFFLNCNQHFGNQTIAVSESCLIKLLFDNIYRVIKIKFNQLVWENVRIFYLKKYIYILPLEWHWPAQGSSTVPNVSAHFRCL